MFGYLTVSYPVLIPQNTMILPFDVLFLIADWATNDTCRNLRLTCQDLQGYTSRRLFRAFAINVDDTKLGQKLERPKWGPIFSTGLDIFRRPRVYPHVRDFILVIEILHTPVAEMPDLRPFLAHIGETLFSSSITTLSLCIPMMTAQDPLFEFFLANSFPSTLHSLNLMFGLRWDAEWYSVASLPPIAPAKSRMREMQDHATNGDASSITSPGRCDIQSLRISLPHLRVLRPAWANLRSVILIDDRFQLPANASLVPAFFSSSPSITDLRIDRMSEATLSHIPLLPNLGQLMLECLPQLFPSTARLIAVESRAGGRLTRLTEFICLLLGHDVVARTGVTVQRDMDVFMRELGASSSLSSLRRVSVGAHKALRVVDRSKNVNSIAWTSWLIRNSWNGVPQSHSASGQVWKQTTEEFALSAREFMTALWEDRI